MAKTPEQSEHTSIKKRVKAVKQSKAQPKSLAQFVGNPREPMPQGLPFHLKDYLELVDWTGRIIKPNKRGALDSDLPPILDRLEIEPEQWLLMATKFESKFASLVGGVYELKRAAQMLGFTRTPGFSNCKAILR